jgi:hypothetical protein
VHKPFQHVIVQNKPPLQWQGCLTAGLGDEQDMPPTTPWGSFAHIHDFKPGVTVTVDVCSCGKECTLRTPMEGVLQRLVVHARTYQQETKPLGSYRTKKYIMRPKGNEITFLSCLIVQTELRAFSFRRDGKENGITSLRGSNLTLKVDRSKVISAKLGKDT